MRMLKCLDGTFPKSVVAVVEGVVNAVVAGCLATENALTHR